MSIVRCADCERNYDTDIEVLYYGKCDSCFISSFIKADMAREYFGILSKKEEDDEQS